LRNNVLAARSDAAKNGAVVVQYAFVILVAMGVVGASSLTTQAQDAGAPKGVSRGMVESVRQVLLETLETGLTGIFEHAIGPSDQLVVRLDDGRSVTVVQSESLYLEPGQRVTVLGGRSGARVVPAD
jgi:outer membrane lipoprotein SlyB